MVIFQRRFQNLFSLNIEIFTVVVVLFSLARSFFVPSTVAFTSFIAERRFSILRDNSLQKSSVKVADVCHQICDRLKEIKLISKEIRQGLTDIVTLITVLLSSVRS